MKKVLLLVEDEITHYRLFERNLKRSDWDAELVWVQFGNRAIEVLEDIDDPANTILVLDINLPDITGIDVLKRIRKDSHLQDMTVVMVTSSRLQEERDTCEQLGIAHFYEKPVEYMSLVNVLKKLDEAS